MELLRQYAPSYDEVMGLRPVAHRIGFDRDYPTLANYYLCEQIPCSPPERCYYAVTSGLAGFSADSFVRRVTRGPAGFTKPCFLRRFPAAWLQQPLIDEVHRRGEVRNRPLEQIYDLGRHEQEGYLVSELVEGLDLARLRAALDEREGLLPWPLALALLLDTALLLEPLFAAGTCHGRLSAARIKLSLRGQVFLCHGLPRPWPPRRDPAAWPDADLRALCKIVLPLALPPAARQQVAALLEPDDPSAPAVLADRLLERHGAPAALCAALSRCFPTAGVAGPPATAAEAAGAVQAVLEANEARALWELALRRSPDMTGGYAPLGAPR